VNPPAQAPNQPAAPARYLNGNLVSVIATDYGGTLTLSAIDHLLGEKPVDPAAASALRTLHEFGINLLVASNTTPGEKRWPALQQAGIDGLFRVALLSYPLGVRKPAPLFYELVLAAAGCPASEVLFVGDNFACDVAGPVAHGMRAALVRPDGLRPGEELPGEALLIRHVRDLPPLLRTA
jgi:FMN phosphatase YigB (HAD superfamily)